MVKVASGPIASRLLGVGTLLIGFSQTTSAFDPGTPLEGVDPSSDVVVNSIYDRSMERAYDWDYVVKAYSGEVGKLEYGDPALEDCYRKQSGTFLLDGNYRGASGTSYLCYDGHPGVDLKANGAWVVAVDEGDITNYYVDSCPDYPDPSCGGGLGNHIEIMHPGGFRSRYGHLKKESFVVSPGQHVSKGQKIAISGNSGASGGAHLHVEFWNAANQRVDPFDYWRSSSPSPSPTSHEGDWAQRRTFPGNGRRESLSFTVSGKGYVGITYFGPREFWEYNPYTNRWTRKSDHPSIEFQSPSFVIGRKAYVVSVNTLWEYDPAYDSWTQKSDVPGDSKRAGFGFSLGGKGYIGGGFFNDCEFWRYDPSRDTWSHRSDHPTLNWYGSCRNGQDIGGVTFTDGEDAYVTGTNIYFWKFNPSSGWTRIGLVGDEWSGSTYSQAFSAGGDGFVFNTLGVLYKYDTSRGTWSKNTEFSGQEVCYPIGFSVNGALFMGVGGVFESNTCTLDVSPALWRFVPD